MRSAITTRSGAKRYRLQGGYSSQGRLCSFNFYHRLGGWREKHWISI